MYIPSLLVPAQGNDSSLAPDLCYISRPIIAFHLIALRILADELWLSKCWQSRKDMNRCPEEKISVIYFSWSFITSESNLQGYADHHESTKKRSLQIRYPPSDPVKIACSILAFLVPCRHFFLHPSPQHENYKQHFKRTWNFN